MNKIQKTTLSSNNQTSTPPKAKSLDTSTSSGSDIHAETEPSQQNPDSKRATIARYLANRVVHRRSWIGFLIFLTIWMIGYNVFFSNNNAIGNYFVGNIPLEAGVLDLEFGYSLKRVNSILTTYKSIGRQDYQRNLLTLDLLFPLLDAGFKLFLIGWCLFRLKIENQWIWRLLTVPIFACGADWIENILLFTATNQFGDISPLIVHLASSFTMTKWIFLHFGMFLCAGFLTWLFFKWFKTKLRPTYTSSAKIA